MKKRNREFPSLLPEWRFRAHIMAEAMSPETAAEALQQPVVQKAPHPSPGQCHEVQMHKALGPVFLASCPVASMRGPFQLEQAEAKQMAPNEVMAVLVVPSSKSLNG